LKGQTQNSRWRERTTKEKKKDIGTNPRHIDHTHRNKMEWSLKQLKIAARGDDWSLDNFVSPIKKA
jgi:hypothetical protein